MLLLIAAVLTGASGLPSAPDCRDADAAMLALPLHEFDQTEAGWRSLDQDGCEHQTAESIHRYRDLNAATLDDDGDTLLWHEAQLRAAAGETEAAIALMEQDRARESDAILPYVEATLAFLRRDRDGLLAARERLVALPLPAAFERAARRYAETYPDLPPLAWPLNLDVVDGLIACFDKPYKEAYGCRPEPARPG